MRGDGVNDAPAVIGADFGIAMGKPGAELAPRPADLILVDNDFGMIVDAVEQGRGIDANIGETLQYLLAGNAGELMFLAVCVISGRAASSHSSALDQPLDRLPACALPRRQSH